MAWCARKTRARCADVLRTGEGEVSGKNVMGTVKVLKEDNIFKNAWLPPLRVLENLGYPSFSLRILIALVKNSQNLCIQ